MFQFLILAISIFITFTILYTSNPLSMGLSLVCQTLAVCMVCGMMAKTFWFSYILLLVFLGGMLILFIYIITIASNEKFFFSSNLLFSFLFFLPSSILIYKTLLSQNKLIKFMSQDTEPIWMSICSFQEASPQIYEIYNFPINIMNIILMIYLLTALIAVVKITEADQGALRSMN